MAIGAGVTIGFLFFISLCSDVVRLHKGISLLRKKDNESQNEIAKLVSNIQGTNTKMTSKLDGIVIKVNGLDEMVEKMTNLIDIITPGESKHL